MNWPNRLSILRIILIPLILIFMVPLAGEAFRSWNQFLLFPGSVIALVIFIIAAFTDYLDGKIARKYNLVTTLGKFLDTIADKLLIISVLIVFCQRDRISAYCVIIIIAREFMITGMRTIAASKGIVIAANFFGKLKTVVQMIAVIYLMLEPILNIMMKEKSINLERIGNILVWSAVFLTIASGWNYIKENMQLFKPDSSLNN